MKACVIFNPNAGSAEQASQTLEGLAGKYGLRLLPTRKSRHAIELARRAAHEGFDPIIAAGGDGTISEVINGVVTARVAHCPRVGVLPLGTGNDFARTLEIPDDPEMAMQIILKGHERAIDLIGVQTAGRRFYCVNVAAGGFSGQVDEVMTDAMKSRWGPLAYVRGAVSVLPDLTSYKTTVRFNGKAPEPKAALNVIVANGRFAGGGTPVAPIADPSDGFMDIVIVRAGGSILELTGVAARLLSAGDYTNSDIVSHQRAKRFEVKSTPGMWFKVDGELIGNCPMTFNMHPRALRILVSDQ